MPLIIKENYDTALIHKNKISLYKNICFPYPLKIGIINIMPFCHAYEFNLIHPLSINIHTVDLHWIKLESHVYKVSLCPDRTLAARARRVWLSPRSSAPTESARAHSARRLAATCRG